MLALLSAVVIIIPLGILNIAIHLNSAGGKNGTRVMQNFTNRKVFPSQKYDIIFLGDSRVLTGINPEFFERKLNCTAFNAAFAGGGVNGQLYRHTAEKLLSNNTNAPRAVVIGITPLTMGQRARNNHQITQTKKEFASQNNSVLFEYIQIPFQKIRTKYVKALFKKKVYTTIPYENGYLERFAKVSKKAQENSINTYRLFFKNYQFSQESLQELSEYIRIWKKENVTVFAFRPPTNISMDTLENESGKCDFSLIQRTVEKSGGVWLEVNERETYNSYDSSHLTSTEAKRLSEDLSEKIATYFRNRRLP